jgi:hypothetical protein
MWRLLAEERKMVHRMACPQGLRRNVTCNENKVSADSYSANTNDFRQLDTAQPNLDGNTLNRSRLRQP